MLPRRGTFTVPFFSRSYIRFWCVLPFATGDHPFVSRQPHNKCYFSTTRRDHVQRRCVGRLAAAAAATRLRSTDVTGVLGGASSCSSSSVPVERRTSTGTCLLLLSRRTPCLPPASNCRQQLVAELQSRRRHCVAFHKLLVASLEPEIYLWDAFIPSLPSRLFLSFPLLSFPS